VRLRDDEQLADLQRGRSGAHRVVVREESNVDVAYVKRSRSFFQVN